MRPSPMPILRILLAQINTTVGDLDGNEEKIADYIARAKKAQADIIVFPELAISGYPPEDLLLKEHFVSDNLKVLNSLKNDTAGITAVIGFVDKGRKKELYNAAAVIYDGKIKGIYHKMCLPNYGVFDERRYFTPGEENRLFQLGPVALGVSICEDVWEKNGPHKEQAKAGAQVLINLSASPYHAGKERERERMLVLRAKETKNFICYVNLVGGQDELVFDGGSYIIGPQGKIIAAGKQFEEDLIMADIEITPAKKPRAFGVKKAVISKNALLKERKPIESRVAKRLAEDEEIYSALVLGTRDYIKKNGFRKAAIGLSGGVDSSLTAAIACDAIGRENVIGVSMPSRFTSGGTREDARVLAENFKLRFIEVPIEGIVSAYSEVLRKEFEGQNRDITEENLQARIRGNILMAFSNKFGWLILTTGNKSEIATGYCTLYGDMAGGFAVIKDVPKTKIYDLARFRNNKEGIPLIPESVFTRAPTAELRENQKDQDTLPPYDLLDCIIKDYVELDKSLSALAKKYNPQVIRDTIRMIDKSEYKRRQAPPGVKITPRAFGRDRRLPITNSYQEH